LHKGQVKGLDTLEALLAVTSLLIDAAEERQAAHGRINHWQLSIVRVLGLASWPSVRSVMALKQRGKRRGKHTEQTHYFISNLQTTPGQYLRLIRQRWDIENCWHWVRDVLLAEDAHRYKGCRGAQVCAWLQTIALNLLSLNGFQSIRNGLVAIAHDITRLLSWLTPSAPDLTPKNAW
jgi:predicted transposase YbfD/YdcC